MICRSKTNDKAEINLSLLKNLHLKRNLIYFQDIMKNLRKLKDEKTEIQIIERLLGDLMIDIIFLPLKF